MKEKVNNLVLFDKVRPVSQWSWGSMCLLVFTPGILAKDCNLEQAAASAIDT